MLRQTMSQNLRPARLGAAPARLLIIAVILFAQALVVGMGWWSGSQNLLTEVVDEYSRRVEAAAQDTASGVALAVARLDVDSIEPGTPGGDRVQAMLGSLDLPSDSIITLIADDGREMYHFGTIKSSSPTYAASAPLNRFNASLVVRSETDQMLSARDAAASAISLRVLLGGVVIILLTGVVALALIAMHERRLVRANKILSKAYDSQAVNLLSAREGMIVGLAKLADYRDTDTGQHLDRIREYSALLAHEARKCHPEINDHYTESLKLASSLHDIGKVGIPDSILLKPGSLTPTERALIEQHTVFGADTLRSIHDRYGNDELLGMSIDIAIAHHERWDGTGYPRQIKGNNIPLSARIVSIADVYDALTSVRVYKEAKSHGEAVDILREGRGTQFDPDLLDAFLRVADEFNNIRISLKPNYSISSIAAAA
jgi:HD-GYP domain-containing protein (c-di-GMP phosphodiesterase class II)